MIAPEGFVKHLIGRKKPRVAEIELTLFENCDVNCAFCDHDKKSVVGMSYEEMHSKLPLIESFFESIDDDIELVNLHMVGGELLQDRLISSKYLEKYTKLIHEYKKISEDFGFDGHVLIVTNMLSLKREEIRSWLDEMNKVISVRLIVSYDPHGRPITKAYLENIEFLKDYISNINVVVTNETIKTLIKGDKIFEQLYKSFPIFMDDFLPDDSTEYLIPSDEEYAEYLHLVRNSYPKLLPFGEAIEKVKMNDMNEIQFTTFNKCNILPDNTVTNYLWTRHNPESFQGEFNLQDNSNMLLNFMNQNQCLSCEYFQPCPLRCPVSWSWKNRTRSEGCVNANFFKTIETQII